MRNTSLAFLFLLMVVPVTAAQTQTRARIVSAPPSVQENQNSSTRSRTMAANVATINETSAANSTKPLWGDSAVTVSPRPPAVAPLRLSSSRDIPSAAATTPKLLRPTSLAVDKSAAVRSAHAPSAASIYRVGVGDVLDIRLANLSTQESTLFTVLKNGALDYPLLSKPLLVAGLTPDEIARRLSAEIRVIENPRPLVSVRDYASHFVLITGDVDNPGRKALRREEMPLFALLAEALPRADAANVTVVRNGKETNLSLSRSDELSMPVIAGDVIRVTTSAAQFVYVGGQIAAAGEKELRPGMTLTQVLMAAGGVRKDRQFTAKISRRDPNGFLRAQDHNLKSIEKGEAADPLLQAGDRIEVRSGM